MPIITPDFFPDETESSNEEVKNILQQLSDTGQELESTRKELAKRKTDFAEFSYAISHTLRKSVANIQGLVSLLQDFSLPDEAKQYLSIVKQEVNNMDDELMELTEVVKLHYSIYDIQERVVLKPVFEKTLSLFQEQLEKIPHEIIQEFSATSTLLANKSLIQHIFQELLSNAIKFRNKDTTLRIEVGSFVSKDRVGIELHDNGIGIDLAKYQNLIFELLKRSIPILQEKVLVFTSLNIK